MSSALAYFLKPEHLSALYSLPFSSNKSCNPDHWFLINNYKTTFLGRVPATFLEYALNESFSIGKFSKAAATAS